MKYLFIFLLIVLNSCDNKNQPKKTDGYAFRAVDSLKFVDINDNKRSQTSSISPGHLKSKSTKKIGDQSKVLNSFKDSIEQVYNYHKALRNELESFYSESGYKPSSNFNHISHIRKYSKVGDIDGKPHTPKYFVDYTIDNLLEKKEFKKYITDRKLLHKLKNKVCWDNYVSIEDTLINGDKIEIEIDTQDFDSLNRVLKYHNKHNYLIEVDGKNPYGSVYSKKPKIELESVRISINDKELKTSIEEYQNIYEPEFCNFGSYQKITEAYEDGENVYVYIFGGNAADSYFAKLIFDKTNGYVTSIIADYVPLSRYGSFGEHFIGY